MLHTTKQTGLMQTRSIGGCRVGPQRPFLIGTNCDVQIQVFRAFSLVVIGAASPKKGLILGEPKRSLGGALDLPCPNGAVLGVEDPFV